MIREIKKRTFTQEREENPFIKGGRELMVTVGRGDNMPVAAELSNFGEQ